MSDPAPERSKSGDPIYRHQSREKPFELAVGDPNHIQLVEQHIAKHLGAPDFVFHEIISDLVHIDIHIVPPRAERNFYTLVTSGMSAKSMTVPPGREEFSYAELLLCLPANWRLKQEDFKDERNYWPIRFLKMLARFPHEYSTWFGVGHTIPYGNPARHFAANTKLCGAIFLPPLLVPKEFHALAISPEMQIHFYAVVPLYQEEMDFKMRNGASALYNLFDRHGVSELLEVKRKNVAKKLFGLF